MHPVIQKLYLIFCADNKVYHKYVPSLITFSCYYLIPAPLSPPPSHLLKHLICMHTYTYMPEGSELWPLMPAWRTGEQRQQGSCTLTPSPQKWWAHSITSSACANSKSYLNDVMQAGGMVVWINSIFRR